MADTPRVTVPVEVIAACEGEQERFEAWAKTARYDMSEHPLHYIFTDPVTDAARRGWNAALSYVRDAAMLSAAPAPEGGAVEGPGDYTMVLTEPQAFEKFPALASHIERMAVGRSVGSLIEWDAFLRELNAALAIREEAPAFDLIEATVSKADGSNTRKVYVYRVEGRIYEIAPAEAGDDDLAARLRRAETWDLDADQEARDRCGVLMLEAAERLENLRAQPQAREDAQPVYALEVVRDPSVEGAKRFVGVTHPAPDALRIAVEALERADRVIGWMSDYVGKMSPPADGLLELNQHWLFMQRDLAALQAEQKGGA